MRKRLQLAGKKIHKYAFTLIELMVVMAIIAVLATLIIGAITIARHVATETAHRSYAHTVQTALESYYGRAKGYPNNCVEMGGHTLGCTTVNASQPCTCPFDTTIKDINSYEANTGFNDTDSDHGSYAPECTAGLGGNDIVSALCPETAGKCDSNGGGFVEYTATGGYNLHIGNYNCKSQIDQISNP